MTWWGNDEPNSATRAEINVRVTAKNYPQGQTDVDFTIFYFHWLKHNVKNAKRQINWASISMESITNFSIVTYLARRQLSSLLSRGIMNNVDPQQFTLKVEDDCTIRLGKIP